MRKQFLNTFKLPFRNTLNIGSKNPRATFKFTSAMLLASSFAFFKNSFNNNLVQNATQEPAQAEAQPQNHLIPFEPFSEEKYQEALNSKHDVVIFCSPDAWIESMVDEVHQVLQGLNRYQAKTRGRKVKFFTINFQSKEEKKEFERKHGVSVGRDSIFLLKNRYSNNMRNFSLEDWFENQRLLLAYFTRMRKLTAKSYEAFTNSLVHLDSDARVFIGYIPKDAPNYKESARNFGKLAIHYGAESNGEINSLLINDPEVAQRLGIKPEQAGKMFMVAKSSKYNSYHRTTQVGKVNLSVLELPADFNGSLEALKGNLAQFYRENFTFMKSDFGDVDADYTLVLQVDGNKIKKNELNQMIDAFHGVHKELKASKPEIFKNLKIVKYNSAQAKGTHRIFLQDNKSRTEDLYAKYYNKKPLTEELKKKIEEGNTASFEYEFSKDSDVTKENLIKFIQDVQAGKVPQSYVGQPAPYFQKYSTRVVQNTYKEQILDVNKHHAVFLCTKHCPGCKFMGRYFEQYALENLRNPDSDIQFDRINSEKNTLEYLPNYPFTPVFLVLNKQDRTKPFVYKIQYGDPQLLKDFIDITTSQQLIDDQIAKNIFESRQKSQQLIGNLKLEQVKE